MSSRGGRIAAGNWLACESVKWWVCQDGFLKFVGLVVRNTVLCRVFSAR